VKDILLKTLTVSMVIAIIGLIIWLASNTTIPNPSPHDHKFDVGEIVSTKIDGRKGMIILRYRTIDQYQVRFGTRSMKTNTRILSEDGNISEYPYTVVNMHEFELERLEERKP